MIIPIGAFSKATRKIASLAAKACAVTLRSVMSRTIAEAAMILPPSS
jgi:hypothetical protein